MPCKRPLKHRIKSLCHEESCVGWLKSDKYYVCPYYAHKFPIERVPHKMKLVILQLHKLITALKKHVEAQK